jgi:hypothetical protein
LDKIAIIREKTTTRLAILGTIDVKLGTREKVVGSLNSHETRAEPKTPLIEIAAPRDSETRVRI